MRCPRAIPPGRNPAAPPSPVVFISQKSCSAYTALPWPNGLKIPEYTDLNLLCSPPPLKYFFPSCCPPPAPPSSTPFLLPPQIPQTSTPLQTPSAATPALCSNFPVTAFHPVTIKNSGTCCVCPISRRPDYFREIHHLRALLQCPQARTIHHEEDAPLASSLFPGSGKG